MGLIGGVAKTAVIAGTATAVSNRVSRRQHDRWAQQGDPYAGGLEQPGQAPPQQYAPVPPPAASAPPPTASAGAEDRVQKLKDLAELKAQGI